MDAAGRLQAFRDMLDEIRKADTPCNTTKAQLQAAVDAIDDWLDANAAAMNSALTAAARNGLTTPQKAMLLMAVIARRYRVGA
jgi:hypothetical protein